MHTIYKTLLTFLVFGVALPALAATVAPSVNQVSVKSGSTFSVQYSIDPRGEKIYTTKLTLGFPPALLKVNSVQFASGWIPLPQPGYDQLDNAKGVLIKTAGYPKGIASPTLFATVQFQMLQTATGTITVESGSLVLNAKSKNVLQMTPTTSTVTLGSSTQKPGQNLFDVTLGIAPTKQGFNWIPWVVGLLILLFAAYVVWIHRRRDKRSDNLL